MFSYNTRENKSRIKHNGCHSNDRFSSVYIKFEKFVCVWKEIGKCLQQSKHLKKEMIFIAKSLQRTLSDIVISHTLYKYLYRSFSEI